MRNRYAPLVIVLILMLGMFALTTHAECDGEDSCAESTEEASNLESQEVVEQPVETQSAATEEAQPSGEPNVEPDLTVEVPQETNVPLVYEPTATPEAIGEQKSESTEEAQATDAATEAATQEVVNPEQTEAPSEATEELVVTDEPTAEATLDATALPESTDEPQIEATEESTLEVTAEVTAETTIEAVATDSPDPGCSVSADFSNGNINASISVSNARGEAGVWHEAFLDGSSWFGWDNMSSGTESRSTWAAPGTHTVSATVQGYDGKSANCSQQVVVPEPAPDPTCNINASALPDGIQATFTFSNARSSADVWHIATLDGGEWFGVNNTSGGSETRSIWAAPGDHTVGFTVQGLEGKSATCSQSVTVAQPQQATATETPLPSYTPTEIPSATNTATAVADDPTATLTSSPTLTETLQSTATFTVTPSATASLTSTLEATSTETASLTPTLTSTATPTLTPTLTETLDPTVTYTPSATVTLTPTVTVEPEVHLEFHADYDVLHGQIHAWGNAQNCGDNWTAGIIWPDGNTKMYPSGTFEFSEYNWQPPGVHTVKFVCVGQELSVDVTVPEQVEPTGVPANGGQNNAVASVNQNAVSEQPWCNFRVVTHYDGNATILLAWGGASADGYNTIFGFGNLDDLGNPRQFGLQGIQGRAEFTTWWPNGQYLVTGTVTGPMGVDTCQQTITVGDMDREFYNDEYRPDQEGILYFEGEAQPTLMPTATLAPLG